MTAAQRFLLIIAIALAGLVGLAMCGYQNWEPEEQSGLFDLASAQSVPELCMDPQQRDMIRGVMLEALDHALATHIEHAFEVWMRDPTGQPDRARTGVERGLRAYVAARKSTLEWSPPPCAG